MTTIGERIDLIIKQKGLKKVQFAERLGINQSYVTHLIQGKNPPSDALVKLICREFGVSEEWLRTGEGEMYASKNADALDSVLDKYALPRELRGLFLGYLGLSDNAKAELRGMLLQWAENAAQSADTTQSAPVQPSYEEPTESAEMLLTPRETPLTEEEINKRVNAYRALLEKERALKLALGYGTPPQTLASGDYSDSGSGETGNSGDDIA